MQLLRLRLNNFRQHEATDLVFDSGLIGIIGANGAGKSTLLEAIGFALYGTDSTRGKKDGLRRRDAPPRARFEVDLTFSFAGSVWQVTRSLTMAELRHNGKVVDNSLRSVTERVSSTLGMGSQEFFNTYFTRQKDLDAMSEDMSPSDRGRFLSRVLQYDKLRSAQELLRKERARCRSALAGLEKGLEDPGQLHQKLSDLTRELESKRAAGVIAANQALAAVELRRALEPPWESAQQKRAAWEQLDRQRRKSESELAQAGGLVTAREEALHQALQALEQVKVLETNLADWEQLITERDRLDQIAQQWSRRNQQLARRDENLRRVGEIRQQLMELPPPEMARQSAEQLKQVQTARAAVEQELVRQRSSWDMDQQEVRTNLEQSRQLWQELKGRLKRIEELGAEEKCPTCQRPLGEEGARVLIQSFRQQIEEMEIRGKYLLQRSQDLKRQPAALGELEQRLRSCQQQLQQVSAAQGTLNEKLRRRMELQRQVEELEKSLSQEPELSEIPPYDAVRHQSVREALTQLEPLRQEFLRLSGTADQVAALRDTLHEARARRESMQQEQLVLDRQIAGLQWDESEYQRVNQSLQEAKREEQRTAADQERLKAELSGTERLRDRLLEEQSRQNRLAQEAQELRNRSALLDELDRSYTALLNQLNREIGPDLAARASVLLDRLTRGRYSEIEMGADYRPVVIDGGEAQPVLSGGEEDVVNLAMRLAISQMIAERSGQPLSLLVLDEIFGSLDEDRRDNVLDMLRALVEEFPQVILITHVEGMREAFDRVIRVVRDEKTGISTVREEEMVTGDVAA